MCNWRDDGFNIAQKSGTDNQQAARFVIDTTLSTEQELVILLSHPGDDEDLAARCETLLNGRVDMDALIRIATHEGVVVLIYRQLQRLGFPGASQAHTRSLRAVCASVAQRNRALCGVQFELLRAFDTAELAVMPYKGAALSQQLYGDVNVRLFNDIDILVRQRDRQRAHAVLLDLGCTLDVRPDNVMTRQADSHEHRYRLPGRGQHPDVFVDLHTDFTPPHFRVALDPWSLPRCELQLDMGVLRHWADDALLLLLCVHGGKDRWSKFAWVSDLATLLARPTLNPHNSMALAENAGARNLLLLGLGIARRVYGSALADDLCKAIDTHRDVQVELRRFGQRCFVNDRQPYLEVLRGRARLRERLPDKARVYAHALNFLYHRVRGKIGHGDPGATA